MPWKKIGWTALVLIAGDFVVGAGDEPEVVAKAPRLLRRFGQTGLNVMTRIMGLLVTVIGVQFIVNGASPILADILRAAFKS